MAVIKPKKKAVIQSGISYRYVPTEFSKHKVNNFFETDKAQDVLDLIKPFEFRGRKFLILDTEDHPLHNIKSNQMLKTVVRRWIGTGKKASPVDVPFCISICDGTNAITLYDTIDNNYAEIKKLAVLLEDPTIEKVYHNTKFDMHMQLNVGIKMKGKLHDTVVLGKLVNENRLDFSLWGISEKRPWGIVKFEYMVDGYKKEAKVTDYRTIPRDLMTQYANADVWNCYNMFIEEYTSLVEQELEPLYDNELELMMALFGMERFGMVADEAYEAPLKNDLQELVDRLEREVYETVGYAFNMNSNAQIHKALIHIDPEAVQYLRFTDKGNPKLDKDEIERLELLGVDLVIKIQAYRKAEKLLGTYAEGIYAQRDVENRVHGSINQTEATTGRMSITKPALQTLPKKDKRIRRIFQPSEGFKMWFMDLDQIEYRLFAHYAQATALIEAIKKGWDVHQATAATVFGVPYDEVTEDQRSQAKTINFGLVYGQGDERTALSLKMTLAAARAFKNRYFGSIPEALPFISTVQRVTRTRGFIKNWYGRRRRLKDNEAYKAPNALIQGCAADYIKHKVVLIYKFLMAHGYKTRMVNIVHDELIFEIHDSEQFLVPKLRWLLSDFEAFRVPITAGAEFGAPSWGQKEAPTEDVGFEPVTAEERQRMDEFNVFDGSVFELVA